MATDPYPPATDRQTAPTLSPFELLAVLWRRKIIVIVALVVSVAAALILASRSPSQYSSTAQLLFREPAFSQATGGTGLFQTGAEEPERTIQTNIDIVTSASVASKARSILHSFEPAQSLLESVSVTPSSNANIALVKATRSSPDEAALVANAFASGYIEYERETDRALIAQAEELVTNSLKTATTSERAGFEESLRQLRVLRALQTGNGELIASAQPDATRVSPKPSRDGLLGGVVGLLLGFGLALLVDFLDYRLKTVEDVERAYEYPLIAGIPRTPARRNAGLPGGQLAGPAGEAYRMLRESIRFLDPTGDARCFVITSAEESEGKSTVAVNLAVSLAALDRRVVLLEADLRRPTAADQLGVLPNTPGLSDLLVTRSAPKDYLLAVPGAESLAVLPSGTTPPNSADLLSAERMSDVIEELRHLADVVIVDSPPLLPVADTRVLMRTPGIDGVILVGRAGVSRRDRVRAAKRILDQSGSRVFGLVVTDVSGSLNGDYYYDAEPKKARGRGSSKRPEVVDPRAVVRHSDSLGRGSH